MRIENKNKINCFIFLFFLYSQKLLVTNLKIMKRSEFLKIMGATALGAAFAPSILANGKSDNKSRIEAHIKELKASVKKPVTFLVLGAGNRGNVYAGYAQRYPDCMKIVGVADTNRLRLENMSNEHDVPQENRFTDWKEALDRPKMADAIVLSLPDNLAQECFRGGVPCAALCPLFHRPHRDYRLGRNRPTHQHTASRAYTIWTHGPLLCAG